LGRSRRYVYNRELEELLRDIVYTLRDYFPGIDVERVKIVVCIDCKSRALARISALPSIWRIVLGLQPMYIIEVIDRNFNKLSSEDKVKVLIHELLHIPRGFTGGLRPHGKYVNDRLVEKLYSVYIERKNRANNTSRFSV